MQTPLAADTITTNLSNSTDGTETAIGNTWLAASFGTSTTAGNLNSVTLLSSAAPGTVASVDIYSDGLLAPGSLVGTLTSPATYTSSLSAATFTTSGLTLAAGSTYWVVLRASAGSIDWAWTADNSGTGTGYQGVWGISSDAGLTWFTSAVYPFQFSVTTAAVAPVPEPATSGLAALAVVVAALIFVNRRRAQGRKCETNR